MKYNNFTYAIISIDDLPKVDFQQVFQTSNETIRRSLDFTKFVLSWEKTPTFIEDELIVPIGIYNHEEVVEIMRSEEWTPKELNEE
tara:strand:- start:1417 stop:1674 length:258 start_codon:yes stop_codon:yes gene_type:complete